ncbi:MAG: ferrous iron transporter B, partial [Ruminococcus sp.]|nr:ferrous iron transporter B [Ruminococcus sp.]
NSAKWTWFAIAYQCGFAYLVALMINQFGKMFTGSGSIIGFIVALIVLAFMLFMLFRPSKETKLMKKAIKAEKAKVTTK